MRGHPVVIGCLLLGVGCSNNEPQASTDALCGDSPPSVQGDLIGWQKPCGDAVVALRPGALIAGQWRGAGRDGPCESDGSKLSCAAGPAGTVIAEVNGADVSLSFQAHAEVQLEALSLEGEVQLPGATAWLSNGFQSWSQSGVMALGEEVSQERLQSALLARGDAEVDRFGHELSWWHTFVGGSELSVVAGALTAGTLRAWVQVFRQDDRLVLRMVHGGAGEMVQLAAGQHLGPERWRLELASELPSALERYGKSLQSRRASHPMPAAVGWNSWYELWDSVDEQAVRANAALVQTMLQPHLPEQAPRLRVVVDDGWQKAWGVWEPNDKFPSGIEALAGEMDEQGLGLGIWLAPLLVSEQAELVAQHPQWFVQDALYDHPKNGPMRVLDVTHPEARAHLEQTVARVVSWGVDLLKIDFLFAGTYEGKRHEPVTGMQAYHRALQTIRTAAGDDVMIVAVGAPALPSLPHVDGWRIGGDIVLEPLGVSWHFVPSQARSIAARWPLCLAVLCDADPPVLREMPREDVETSVWVASLTGGALFLSDDLRALPQERRSWGLDTARLALGLGGQPAVPQDLIAAEPPEKLTNAIIDQLMRRSQHVLPAKWRLPDGSLVAFNFSDEEQVIDGVTVPAHGARLVQ